MDEVVHGRVLMGDSLGFHILFALLGVGIPLLVSLVELLGLWRKDNHFLLMARRWSYLMSVLFVTGALSGMIISNQLSVLWPSFMAIAGEVVGPAFYTEAFAFFIEAIFLGIYLYSWDRFANPFIHWLCSLPIVLGSALPAFFITSANAWMNNPQGFTYKNGIVSNIDPIKALFNHATFSETTHSIVSYYLTTALCFAGAYAFFLLREKTHTDKILYYKKALTLLVSLGFLFSLLIGVTGDTSARYIAEYEPAKFAVAENVVTTSANAPLKIGGVFLDKDHDELSYALSIPGFLSFLVGRSFDVVVKGLDAFDPNLLPPRFIHYMFDLMVLCGVIEVLVTFLFLVFYFWKRTLAFSKGMLVLLFLTGFSGFFAVEFGWILTEVGRQPYAISGILKTSEAFTTSAGVVQFGFIFPMLYLVLFILTPWILLRHYKKYPLDLSKKYL